MLCSELTLVNQNGTGGIATPLRCKQWKCEICFPFNVRKLKRWIAAGNPDRMLTLTSVLGSKPTASEAARELVRAWRLIRLQAKRELGIERIRFVAVFEETKNGWPHLHIALCNQRLPQAWLSNTLRRLTGACCADIRKFSSAREIAKEIGKYASKKPIKFDGSKRYWSSIKWAPELADDEDVQGLFGERWVRHDIHIGAFVNDLKRQGIPFEAKWSRVVFGDWLEHPPPW